MRGSPKLGKLIRDYRLKKGLTQSELASQLGYQTPQFICLIETDKSKIPLNRLGRLLSVLGIPENEVLKVLIDDYQEQVINQIRSGRSRSRKASNGL